MSSRTARSPLSPAQRGRGAGGEGAAAAGGILPSWSKSSWSGMGGACSRRNSSTWSEGQPPPGVFGGGGRVLRARRGRAPRTGESQACLPAVVWADGSRDRASGGLGGLLQCASETIQCTASFPQKISHGPLPRFHPLPFPTARAGSCLVGRRAMQSADMRRIVGAEETARENSVDSADSA